VFTLNYIPTLHIRIWVAETILGILPTDRIPSLQYYSPAISTAQ
jgi:hypothetical protein